MNFDGFFSKAGSIRLLYMTIIYIVCVIGVVVALTKAPVGAFFNVCAAGLFIICGWLLWRNGWSKFKG